MQLLSKINSVFVSVYYNYNNHLCAPVEVVEVVWVGVLVEDDFVSR